MLKKILVSSLVLVGVFSVAYAVFAADGSNYVDVNSCTQVGKDIRISRDGQKYTLTSSCRNAGHGYRDYKMTCVSNSQYKVEWTEGCVPAKPPTPVKPPVVKDIINPSVTLTTNKKSYIEGEIAYITATASDNVRVKKINVYNEAGTLLRTCSYVNTCTGTDLITFNAPTGINWGITGFSARAYDEAGNEGYKYLDVEVNRKIVSNNLSISAPISLFNENGVSWIRIAGNAYADAGVSSVEIYLGTDNTKYSQPLVKKCTFNGSDKNAACVLSFPRSLYHGGFYWARVIAKDGSAKDSDLTYYNY